MCELCVIYLLCFCCPMLLLVAQSSVLLLLSTVLCPPCTVAYVQEGALQPVINLLSSSCQESQREAALLLGQFATQQPDDDGPDYKSRIVQRGAVPPLIRMLGQQDVALKEMAAFALGRLAQNSHNQAGIVQVSCQAVRVQICCRHGTGRVLACVLSRREIQHSRVMLFVFRNTHEWESLLH